MPSDTLLFPVFRFGRTDIDYRSVLSYSPTRLMTRDRSNFRRVYFFFRSADRRSWLQSMCRADPRDEHYGSLNRFCQYLAVKIMYDLTVVAPQRSQRKTCGGDLAMILRCDMI